MKHFSKSGGKYAIEEVESVNHVRKHKCEEELSDRATLLLHSQLLQHLLLRPKETHGQQHKLGKCVCMTLDFD